MNPDEIDYQIINIGEWITTTIYCGFLGLTVIVLTMNVLRGIIILLKRWYDSLSTKINLPICEERWLKRE